MFLWIRLNSELLRYQGVQNFAKNNTENAELASKMLKQQHFLYQRKNLYNQEPSRSSSGEIVPENLHENLQPEFFISALYRTLFWSSGWCHWRQWPDISAEREPVGHPWQYKIEDIGNTQEGEKLDINISDIETSARGLRNTWVYTGCVMKKKHIVWAGRWVMCFFFMFLADRM